MKEGRPVPFDITLNPPKFEHHAKLYLNQLFVAYRMMQINYDTLCIEFWMLYDRYLDQLRNNLAIIPTNSDYTLIYLDPAGEGITYTEGNHDKLIQLVVGALSHEAVHCTLHRIRQPDYFDKWVSILRGRLEVISLILRILHTQAERDALQVEKWGDPDINGMPMGLEHL